MRTKNTLFINLILSSLLYGCNSGNNGTTSPNIQDKNILSSSSNKTITPLEEYDQVFSPDGPSASLEDLKQIKSKARLRAGKNTQTYVRCYYTKYSDKLMDTSLTNVANDYIWATNSDGSYYKISGYWNTDGITAWANMFFTSVTLSEIQQTCDRTLSEIFNKSIQSFYQVAADNNFSFNHTIWQNDSEDTRTTANKIISFGDSLTDNNNVYNGSSWKMPNNGSWLQGRFTNGYTWVEYLAKNLEIPIYNWAIGGSEGTNKYVVLSGLNEQIQSWVEYMKSAKNYNVNKTLFTILVGGNDFVNDNRNPTDVANDVKIALNTLSEHGAKNILLLNLPDVTKAPVFHMGKNSDEVRPKITEYNNQLTTLVKEFNRTTPKTNVMLFDTQKTLNKVLENPSAYGFSNTYDPCLDISVSGGTFDAAKYLLKYEARSSCTDASKFVFWDTLHPTTATHRILAKEAFSFVTQNFKFD